MKNVAGWLFCGLYEAVLSVALRPSVCLFRAFDLLEIDKLQI